MSAVPASYRARIHHPQTIRMCRVLALEFLQVAFTNTVKARHTQDGNAATYHAIAADNIEEALIWIRDIAE
jgi:hypothetical protein